MNAKPRKVYFKTKIVFYSFKIYRLRGDDMNTTTNVEGYHVNFKTQIETTLNECKF